MTGHVGCLPICERPTVDAQFEVITAEMRASVEAGRLSGGQTAEGARSNGPTLQPIHRAPRKGQKTTEEQAWTIPEMMCLHSSQEVDP